MIQITSLGNFHWQTKPFFSIGILVREEVFVGKCGRNGLDPGVSLPGEGWNWELQAPGMGQGRSGAQTWHKLNWLGKKSAEGWAKLCPKGV